MTIELYDPYLNTTKFSTAFYNTTTAPVDPDGLPAYLGYINLLVCSAFYGLNYMPVKKYETGDGIFFQFVVCTAIWSTGVIVHWLRNFPKFYALPLLGGFFWTTANLSTVPVIKMIGIGLGSLFWNTSGLILGWAIARFGLFSIKPEIPTHIALNYTGVVLAALSIILFMFIKPKTDNSLEKTPLLDETDHVTMADDSNVYVTATTATASSSIGINDASTSIIDQTTRRNSNDLPGLGSVYDNLSSRTKHVLGITLSLMAGILYAVTYSPALYVQTNYPGASQNSLDFSFSLSTGIFLSSLGYLIIYCIFKKNKPDIYPEVIFPALISGWMWGIANNCFFIASNGLSQAISFPIANAGPSMFACIGGLFYHEIKGTRNFVFLIIGSIVCIAATVLCGISK